MSVQAGIKELKNKKDLSDQERDQASAPRPHLPRASTHHVQILTVQTTSKTLQLLASSKEERDQWVSAINETLRKA